MEEAAPYVSMEEDASSHGEMEETVHYVLMKANASDIEQVVACYQICPVPGYEVASVRGIVNPVLEQGFELHLQRLSRRSGKRSLNRNGSRNPVRRKRHFCTG